LFLYCPLGQHLIRTKYCRKSIHKERKIKEKKEQSIRETKVKKTVGPSGQYKNKQVLYNWFPWYIPIFFIHLLFPEKLLLKSFHFHNISFQFKMKWKQDILIHYDFLLFVSYGNYLKVCGKMMACTHNFKLLLNNVCTQCHLLTLWLAFATYVVITKTSARWHSRLMSQSWLVTVWSFFNTPYFQNNHRKNINGKETQLKIMEM